MAVDTLTPANGSNGTPRTAPSIRVARAEIFVSDRKPVIAAGTKVGRDSMPVVVLGGGAPVTTYFQRVWDITNSVFCVYSGTSINAAPASGDTTPSHSGNISNHAVYWRTP